MAASPRRLPGENHSSFSLTDLMWVEPACVRAQIPRALQFGLTFAGMQERVAAAQPSVSAARSALVHSSLHSD